ncbi:MAG: hypothetical protein KAI71_01120 [Candidatus Pacebacteria bacterium]|nr:hypothetical protein [Candidatus Paceibacterota bacterium]
MQNKTQNPNQSKNQFFKKEPFFLMTIKTLLAILIFTALLTIIIGGGYIIWEYSKTSSNNQPVLFEKQVVLIIDKTEYQIGEKVKLTVKNNLDDEIEFYTVAVEKFNNKEWQQIRFDIECLGLCTKIQTVINSKNNKSFLWDQKDNIGLQIMGGKFRFIIGLWDNDWNGSGLPLMFNYYSNEFKIKDSVIGPSPGNMVCGQDSDCEINYANYCCGKWEGCFNKYDNPGTIGDLNDPNCKCIKKEPIKECRCVNNICQPVYESSKETKNSDKIIKNLIQQMGDDNISQETKNAIPGKLYDYGKEAISYLIEALDDERVFDNCYMGLSGIKRSPNDKCNQCLVKQKCKNILYTIVNPKPILYKHLQYMNYNVDWQQWWDKNQDKSLNEIRKMVRDWYRAEEEKNNYSTMGYRGEEYDYLDFTGDLSHDDFLLKFKEVCTGFDNLKQVDYLKWPISCGCLSVDRHSCYRHFAEYNKDASVCDKITWDVFGRDSCYWAVAVELNKVGMNDKIDFCSKIEDAHIENHARQKACFELAK